MVLEIIETMMKGRENPVAIFLHPVAYKMLEDELGNASAYQVLGLPVYVDREQEVMVRITEGEDDEEVQTEDADLTLQADGEYLYVGGEHNGELVVFAAPRKAVAAILMGLMDDEDEEEDIYGPA